MVTSLLTEALVARGIDVTLFATKDSRTAATLAGVCPTSYSEDPAIDAKVWEMLHVAHVFERAGEFDLIHTATLTHLVSEPRAASCSAIDPLLF